jgi:hypothetical protein
MGSDVMVTLTDQLADAQANVERLQREIAQADCLTVGCDLQHIGGRNAACSDDCACSVPVRVCTKCGDSDYGDNPEAEQTMADCAARRAGDL